MDTGMLYKLWHRKHLSARFTPKGCGPTSDSTVFVVILQMHADMAGGKNSRYMWSHKETDSSNLI